MIGKPFDQGGANDLNETIRKLSHKKDAPKAVFVALLVLYLAASIALRKVASDLSMIFLFGGRIPIQAFAGVFSSLSNICLIFLAVFFGRVGFLTSLVILVAQFPMMAAGMIVNHNLTTIPGFFSNIFAIIAVTVIYINHARVHNYQRRIVAQAATDRLTGLPNRFACAECMDSLAARSEKFAVISIDVNNFKSVNDTMGHEVGDRVLMELAGRWASLAADRKDKTSDFLARLGGDEYAVVIRGCSSCEELEEAVEAYKAELKNKITIDGCDYFMGACFGYAEFPADAGSGTALLSCADAAMHEAKRRGAGNNVLKFEPAHIKTERTLDMERKIRAALDEGNVFFRLQPQYDMGKKLRGFEALARMNDADGSVISPADFIPVAEQVGLIDRIDTRVFMLAAEFLAKHIKERDSSAVLCVNVSVRHLMRSNFIEGIKDVLALTGFPADHLEIEITESVLIDSADKALERIMRVKDMGIKVAIDDFGTGYSSLNYLNKFPADVLKIDKSFIDVMNSSEASKKYVATIISIGHILNLQVISEGVETQEQLDTLREVGCDYIQGFIWGKPLPPEEAAELL